MIPFMKFEAGPKTTNLERASAKPAIAAKARQKPHKYAGQRRGEDLATIAKLAKAQQKEPKRLAAYASEAKTCETTKPLNRQWNICGLAELATLARPPEEKREFVAPDDKNTVLIKSWRSLIGGLKVPSNYHGNHIGTIALHFLSSSHAIKAVNLGWNELALFGLFDSQHPTAPLRRFDAMGLVPSLATSRLGARLQELEAEQAILKTRSGSHLVYRKNMTGHHYSIPLWRHPLLGSEKS